MYGKVLNHEQSAKSNGVCLAIVINTVTKYVNGSIDAVTEFKRNINSNNARRKVDGRVEARLIEFACGPAPEGQSRWTIPDRKFSKNKISIYTTSFLYRTI